MIVKQIFDELSQKISETVASSPVKDIEKNAKSMVSSALSKMDLVTREEFDVQQQVLVKTRMKLNELETRLAELEARLGANLATDDSLASDSDVSPDSLLSEE